MTDIRIINAMIEQRKTDNSFKEKPAFGGLFGGINYPQPEVREIWFQGIEYGIERGLYMASLEGQRIDISNNCDNEKHKEFYRKFLELAAEYKCAIQYHPLIGMCVIDREYNEQF